MMAPQTATAINTAAIGKNRRTDPWCHPVQSSPTRRQPLPDEIASAQANVCECHLGEPAAGREPTSIRYRPMRMKRGIVILACLASLSGCATSGTRTSRQEATPPTSLTTIAPGGPLPPREFQIYTHCGVNGAMIDGRWWKVSPPLEDGNGNPPPPWNNGAQDGVLRFTSDDTAVFTAKGSGPDGAQNPELTVTLHRTDSTEYPFICA